MNVYLALTSEAVLTERSEILNQEIRRLAKWQGVADAEATAAELLQIAQQEAGKAKADAATVQSQAQDNAQNLLATAEADSRLTP